MSGPNIYRAFGKRHVKARTRRHLRQRFDWPIEMWILVAALVALVFLMPRLWEAHEASHNRSAQQR